MKKVLSTLLIMFCVGNFCGSLFASQTAAIEKAKNFRAKTPMFGIKGTTLQDQFIAGDAYMKEEAISMLNEAKSQMDERVAKMILQAVDGVIYKWDAQNVDGNIYKIVVTRSAPNALNMKTGGKGVIHKYNFEVNLKENTICATDFTSAGFIVGDGQASILYDKVYNKGANWKQATKIKLSN